MKRIIIISTLLLFWNLGYCQKKKDLLKEINGYYSSIVSNATFDKPQKDIWNALYTIIQDQYPNITKESESRGYIEAKSEAEYYKSTISAELIGEAPKIKVAISIVAFQKVVTNYYPLTYSDWQSSNAQEKKQSLQIKLYESLNGEIELPKELKEKIDKYNLSEKKEKNRVIKNVDY